MPQVLDKKTGFGPRLEANSNIQTEKDTLMVLSHYIPSKVGDRFRLAGGLITVAILATATLRAQAAPSARLVPAETIPCQYGLSVDDLAPVTAGLVSQQRLEIAIRVSVDERGQIDDAVVEKSSGNEVFDHLALRASRSAVCKPFPGKDGTTVPVDTNFVFSVTGQVPDRLGLAASGPTSASQPSLVVLPPALQKAVEEASLKRLGIAPGSKKAEIITHWGMKIIEDPDIQKLAASNKGMPGTVTPAVSMLVSSIPAAALRLTPDDRSRFVGLITKVFDTIPADCGGMKTLTAIISRYMITNLSDDDFDEYLRIVFEMLRQTALHAPLVQISDDQRKQGEQAVMDSLGGLIKDNPVGARDLAGLMMNNSGVTPTQWCNATRLSLHALDATPQPYRDWAFIARTERMMMPGALSSTVTVPQAGLPQSSTPSGMGFAEKVQQRVRPNIVWTGPVDNREAVIQVQCASNGNIESATIARSSGYVDWDQAALFAVRRSDPMPVDVNGSAPRVFTITMRPASSP